MVAVYNIQFHEPWQDVLVKGTFNRWVENKERAEYYRAKYEIYYQQTYADDFAKVELVSVS